MPDPHTPACFFNERLHSCGHPESNPRAVVHRYCTCGRCIPQRLSTLCNDCRTFGPRTLTASQTYLSPAPHPPGSTITYGSNYVHFGDVLPNHPTGIWPTSVRGEDLLSPPTPRPARSSPTPGAQQSLREERLRLGGLDVNRMRACAPSPEALNSLRMESLRMQDGNRMRAYAPSPEEALTPATREKLRKWREAQAQEAMKASQIFLINR